ncbi:hypothetical protein [Streptomyces hirsutus]|uniref:hypothetical protein n=1 Tax=Streptomyces hirsutus TaxID=35620 RepID=UPI0006E3597C|nr:hypothetical protein [Streptomyces hirsutus]
MTLNAPGKALRAGFGPFQLPGGRSTSSQGIPGVVRRLPADVKESGEATEKYLPQSAQRGYDNSAHVEEHD